MTTTRLVAALPQVYATAALRVLIPIVVLPLVASRVGAEAFGRLGFILVWAALLSTLVEGGFVAAATRLAVAADDAGRWSIARRVCTARLALSLLALPLAALAVRWGAPDDAHAARDVLAIAALACAYAWTATWYLQATQQLARWARVEFVVYAAMIVAAVAGARSVGAYVAIQLVASTTLAVAGWWWLWRDLATVPERRPLVGRDALGPGLRLGWTMLPVAIAGAAYTVALPAAASAQLGRAELGAYFLVDRIVRAVVSAADPVYSLVYPRIVALQAVDLRRGLRYAARWAALGSAAGALLYAAVTLGWPLLASVAASRGWHAELVRAQPIVLVLAGIWPVVLGWKFIGYWMLGSGRHDNAYRLSIVAAGIVGVALAATVGGAAGPIGLAWTAIGVELVVVAVATLAMGASAWRRPAGAR